jgi:hypothetical protein
MNDKAPTHYVKVDKKTTKAEKLSTARTAWSCPQFRSNFKAESEVGLSAGSSNLRFVGQMKINVNGITAPISRAPISQFEPAPASHAVMPEAKEIAAKETCMTVARL